jgi:hypothetical protein
MNSVLLLFGATVPPHFRDPVCIYSSFQFRVNKLQELALTTNIHTYKLSSVWRPRALHWEANQVGLSDNAFGLYSGGARFETHSEHQLFWMRIFMVFSVFPAKCQYSTLNWTTAASCHVSYSLLVIRKLNAMSLQYHIADSLATQTTHKQIYWSTYTFVSRPHRKMYSYFSSPDYKMLFYWLRFFLPN